MLASDSFGQSKIKRFVCFDGLRPWSRLLYVSKGTITFSSIEDSCDIIKAQSGDILYLPNNVTYESVIEDTENYDYFTVLFSLKNREGKTITVSDEICIMAKDEDAILLNTFKNI